MSEAPHASRVLAAAPEANPSEDTLVARLRGVAAIIVAVLVLIGFAGFVAYLVAHVNSSTQSWTRYVYLFGAVQALLFTAFGWLFGREVNRQAVKSAESRADTSSTRAEVANAVAADQKARGEALRAGIEARANRAATTGAVEERGIDDAGGGATVGNLDELVAFARTLFP
jgi:uncharacterized membrane protein YgcG